MTCLKFRNILVDYAGVVVSTLAFRAGGPWFEPWWQPKVFLFTFMHSLYFSRYTIYLLNGFVLLYLFSHYTAIFISNRTVAILGVKWPFSNGRAAWQMVKVLSRP